MWIFKILGYGGFGGLFQRWFVWILVYANGGSVDCSDGGSDGSWFMPTVVVWFVWIVLMVVRMDLGLCQRWCFGSFGLFQWWFVWILVYANGGGLVRLDCSNGGSYGSWFMPTAVRLDWSNGVLYGSWFMPTAEVWFGWIGPMVFCMDLGLCQRRFGWIVPMVVRMDLGLCQRRFGWIVPMVVLLQYFVTFPSTE
jgi:hypothetical protein